MPNPTAPRKPCRRCRGTGSLRHDLRCPACAGTGNVPLRDPAEHGDYAADPGGPSHRSYAR